VWDNPKSKTCTVGVGVASACAEALPLALRSLPSGDSIQNPKFQRQSS
jgi:hypothetical protein